MKISINPTSKIIQLETDGGAVPARVWEGVTESGIPVHAFITGITPTLPVDDPRQQEFQDALQEVEPPSASVNFYPARLLL